MVRLIGISLAGEKDAPRLPVQETRLAYEGLVGDRKAGPGLRQVSLMGETSAKEFAAAAGQPFAPGYAKENLLIAGLETLPLRLLDRIQIEDALLELTVIGKRLSVEGRTICAPGSTCAHSELGAFARVVHPGILRMDAHVIHHPRTLRVRIVTLSDRASRGVYEDQSGPCAAERVEAFGERAHWQTQIEREIIQDDAELLEAILVQARQARVDIVITTGGTGMGPRDITPDVVSAHADRIIPGIMEHIRLKFGAEKPLALLSRSVAAVYGRTLVFALPGSPKAVEEYLGEIEKVLEHLLLVVRGIEAH